GSSRLSAHLTNTALQAQHGEENVRLLQELVGSRLFSASSQNVETARLTQGDVDFIIDEVAASLGEVFRACLTSPVHFQTLPNTFELFGVDLLVTYNPAINDRPFQVHLLELNAEPAIHLTGPRLEWILEELFNEISHTCQGKPAFVSGYASAGRGRMVTDVGMTVGRVPNLHGMGAVREDWKSR
ncbi:hypothetical protein FS842_007479, partial [Serendipita sp. 407]